MVQQITTILVHDHYKLLATPVLNLDTPPDVAKTVCVSQTVDWECTCTSRECRPNERGPEEDEEEEGWLLL